MAGETVSVGGLQADVQLEGGDKLADDLRKLQAASDKVAAEIGRLQGELKAGSIDARTFDNVLGHLMATQEGIQAATQQVTLALEAQADAMLNAATATTRMNAGARATSSSIGNATKTTAAAGQAMMQLGYAVDDLQYGFKGIVNNIAPFTYQMAVAAGVSHAAAGGIAAGVQIAAVATYQLYENWDKLADAIGVSGVRTEAEQMEILAKNTERTADETARLNRYKKEQAEILAMMAKRPKEEEEANKAVENAITEADAEKVYKGVRETLVASGRGERMNPAEQAELKKMEDLKAQRQARGLVAAEVQKDIDRKQKEINDRIDAENDRRAKEIMNDPKKRDTLKALVKANPKAFPPNFGDALAETPEALKAYDEENAAFDRENQRAKDAREIRQEKARVKKKKDDDLTRELNEMGRDIEHQTREENPDLFRNPMRARRADERAGAAEAKRAAKAEDERFDEAANQVRDQIPDIDRRVREAELNESVRRSMGKKPRDLSKMIGEQLIKEGVDKDTVATAVPQLRMDAKEKIGKANAKAAAQTRGEYEDVGRSQQFGVLDLAARVQGGVGGESKKHTSQFDKMIEILNKLADSGGNSLKVEVG
jgi:hypothetical protein